MATLLEAQVSSVLDHPEARKVNLPGSNRTYYEILTDPEAGDLIKRDVVETFRKIFIKAPPITEEQYRRAHPEEYLLRAREGEPWQGQRLLPTEGGALHHAPTGAPAGGLQTGETVSPEGLISYDPALEATQRATIKVNLGSLVSGEMTAGGVFLPGPPRPGSPSQIFRLPLGMRADEITQGTWDEMLRAVRQKFPKEYQEAKEFDHALKSGAISATREAILGVPALLDLPGLLVRGADYVISPVGTNTLRQDVQQGILGLLGLPNDELSTPTDVSLRTIRRPVPSSIWMDRFPRLMEAFGLYPNEFPNALLQPLTGVIRPDAELAPFHKAFGELLDATLIDMGVPGILTAQQDTESQKIATFLFGVMGGSLTASGAARAGAQLVVKGKTLADLQDATTLTRALYSLANSPSAQFAWRGKRRFSVHGAIVYSLKDQAIAGTAGTAMLMTPDAWGPTGKIIAGIGVPFSLGKAKTFLTAWTRGQGLPLVGGFTEPFTAAGQQRLAARYWAAIPGVEGNERLIVSLLNDVKNIPKRAGQSELVTTPAYFGKVSDDLLAAERDWLALRERGVSDADAIAQLSQNPTYGRYFTERFPVFKDQPPSLKVLEETRTKLKLVSDNLYGAMSWLASGSPIKNEVLRASGERLRVAEQIFKDLSRNFEGDPGAASAYVQKALEKLDELADEALATHATDALLYNRLKKLVEDPELLTRKRISDAERAVEGVRNASRDMREIEKAFWTHIGADQITISAENMALIGDRAAEIILDTPAARRKQIPALVYAVAGKRRILSDEALDNMAKAAGAAPETPAAIRTARANLASLRARKRELGAAPYISRDLKSARQRVAELEAKRTDPSFAALSDARKTTWEQQNAAAAERLRILEAEAAPNPKIQNVDTDIAAQEARLASLEGELLPPRTAGDEVIVVGQNGILDNVDSLEQVLALRGALLDEAFRARPRQGGANTVRIANEMQGYIIDDWLQNPEIFGEAGATIAYDVARKFSADFNTRYTRGPMADFVAVAADRGDKVDPNQFLTKIIRDNKTGPDSLPTGSVDALDAALVRVKSPFLIRNEDGALFVDPNASLTPGLENFTWESIRTGGPGSEKLSAQLLREEILNRLALAAFDNYGEMNPIIVSKSIRAWALPIAKVEESYPGFRAELKELAVKGDELATRNKMLNNPTQASVDRALVTQDLDELASMKDAGRITNRIKADHSVASTWLDNDPNVVAATFLENPKMFENDIVATLKILDSDQTGAARAGFQRAILNELTRRTLGRPETAGRMAGEAVVDPAQINQLLTKNETALRRVFSDVVGKGPDGKDLTSYDMLKMFNDEVSIGMSERLGMSAGTREVPVQLPLSGGEFIRHLGRYAGVYAAKLTGGPALVMAGTGGRLAGKIYQMGGLTAILTLVADAIADPQLARILLTETATLDEAGKFVFDKRLTNAVRPYQFMAGPPTQVLRESIQQQREIDRIKREGGEREIRYDPKEDIYIRQKSPRTSLQPPGPASRLVASNMPPSRAPVPESVLGQVSPVGQRPMPTGTVSQETLAGLSQVGLPLFHAAHGGYVNGGESRSEESGIMSIGCKPRQIVG